MEKKTILNYLGCYYLKLKSNGMEKNKDLVPNGLFRSVTWRDLSWHLGRMWARLCSSCRVMDGPHWQVVISTCQDTPFSCPIGDRHPILPRGSLPLRRLVTSASAQPNLRECHGENEKYPCCRHADKYFCPSSI